MKKTTTTNTILTWLRTNLGNKRIDYGVKVNLLKDPASLPPAQLSFYKALVKAIEYGNEQVSDLKMRALYETGISKKNPSAYLVACSDVLHAPVIEKIDVTKYHGNARDVISITATDDFKVASVSVHIRSRYGTPLEWRDAVQSTSNPGVWIYKGRHHNKSLNGCIIRVMATDLAGNRTVVKKAMHRLGTMTILCELPRKKARSRSAIKKSPKKADSTPKLQPV